MARTLTTCALHAYNLRQSQGKEGIKGNPEEETEKNTKSVEQPKTVEEETEVRVCMGCVCARTSWQRGADLAPRVHGQAPFMTMHSRP